MTNGLSHPYHLEEYIFILRGARSTFSFLKELHVIKQNSPRWDAAFCGVTSGLFCLLMSHKMCYKIHIRVLKDNSILVVISVVTGRTDVSIMYYIKCNLE